MRVKVVGLPAEFTAIQMERVGHAPGLGDGRFIRICDYLLVAESDTNTQAVFIELKKTATTDKQPVRTEPARRIQDEEYKDIRVRVCVGTPVSLATLTGE